MIVIKSDDDIEMMKIPAKVTAEILRDLRGYIRPGLSTKDIDDFIDRRIKEAGMVSGRYRDGGAGEPGRAEPGREEKWKKSCGFWGIPSWRSAPSQAFSRMRSTS